MKDDRSIVDPIWGHSENDHGEAEPLSLHLRTVSQRCGQFAEAFGCLDEGIACGLFHDLGKLGPPAQKRLRGKGRGIDHWSYGAHRIIKKYGANGLATAYSILGHHQGLTRIDKDGFSRLQNIEKLREHAKMARRELSEPAQHDHLTWLTASGLTSPESVVSIRAANRIIAHEAAVMADVRMLFSALVDADFLETEAHFRAPARGQRYERPKSPDLQPERALRLLLDYIDKTRQEAKGRAPVAVIQMRDDLLTACRAAAHDPQGVFTLSAPTGSGKTLAMLALALEHAVEHGLRRIVLVIPYLSIIEQTARIYREIFEDSFGPDYILEHHSLARGADNGEKDDARRAEDDRRDEAVRLVSENWDAPIVITTSVQFFESLFSNRPSACRKLHRLAQSVVLFDEVQTFPTVLAIPTLATLAHLAERHRCTTVFATATQPAFTHFDDQVKQIGGPGWKPAEIVPRELKLFDRAKRTTIHWPESGQKTSWDEMTRELGRLDRVLCIVNLKRHAIELLNRLQDSGEVEGLFHLSTNMCPLHREQVLAEVRGRLSNESAGPCRLIATQCVEAGVDIDFPVVYRAMGPLEAIAQAAGRCNRNGRLATGHVHVFLPDPNDEDNPKARLYPSGDYEQAAMRTATMLNGRALDLDDPDVFRKYYEGLYALRDFSEDDVLKAVKGLDFEDTAKHYRLIRCQTVNLVVPFDRQLFDSLQAEAHDRGLSGEWIRRARPLSVSIYGDGEKLQGVAEPVRLPDWAARRGDGKEVSDEWFLLPEMAADSYDAELLGLKKLPESCGWIA